MNKLKSKIPYIFSPFLILFLCPFSVIATENKAIQKVPIYHKVLPNGAIYFSDIPPKKGKFTVLTYDCFACRPLSQLNWHKIKLYQQNYHQIIEKTAKKHKLDPAIIKAIIHAESNFNHLALSRKGAMGLMQLMPNTAKELGVINAFIPEENINAGSQYFAKLLKRFDGNLKFAIAAYNAGPSNVKRYQGVPPFAETRAYIERVNILIKRYRQQS